MQNVKILALALWLGLGFAACKQEGPAEKAGKEIDKAAKEMGQAMDRAADAVKDATKSK